MMPEEVRRMDPDRFVLLSENERPVWGSNSGDSRPLLSRPKRNRRDRRSPTSPSWP